MSKVTVSLLVSETITYHRRFEMDKAEHEKLLADLDYGDRVLADRTAETLHSMLSMDDFHDAANLEILEFTIVKAKKRRLPQREIK